MVLEGVFERFPKLRVVLIEGGFVWVPSLCWRLDKHWKTLRSEVPHLKRAPSEYVREHFWFTSQPIEEPEDPRHMLDAMDWVGWDKILFSTDYPHWDFDDPKFAFARLRLTPEQHKMLFRDNAKTPLRAAVAVPQRYVVAKAGEIPLGGEQGRHRRQPRDRDLQSRRRIFRAAEPLPARRRTVVPGPAHRAVRIEAARHVHHVAAGRDAALPVAWLGVRYPHRPFLLRSGQGRAPAPMRSTVEPGQTPRRRPIHRRDLSGVARRKLHRGGDLKWNLISRVRPRPSPAPARDRPRHRARNWRARASICIWRRAMPSELKRAADDIKKRFGVAVTTACRRSRRSATCATPSRARSPASTS